MKEMKILDESIEVRDDFLDINELKFLKDNPRVYACTHGVPNFDNLPEEQQQEVIYKELLKEPSVKNLLPEIRRHGGLMESILVRWDTKEVIEGNSRLAVYRKLHESLKEAGEWNLIPCDLVSSLTDRQQAAYLNQIHVKGKTQWSAFEKANFAYVRKEKGANFKEIANLFGESEQTIRIRINVIKIMKKNKDNDRSHFSYYDVIVRSKDISNAIKEKKLPNLLQDVKHLGSDEEKNKFTAQDLRKKLPKVLGKPKVLKKYIEEKIDLDEAYQRANISRVEENVKRATDLLQDVESNVEKLDNNAFNAFKQAVKKLEREVTRISKMIKNKDQK